MDKSNRKEGIKMKRVMFISSTGGHLSELLQLEELFSKYEYSLLTEKTKANKALKKKYKNVSFLIYGTKDHKLSYYLKYHPDYIITTGAHTAGPMCCLARIFGSKVIYIETFANMNTKTITGTLFYHLRIANLFLVQWNSMLKLYPKATLGGWIY